MPKVPANARVQDMSATVSQARRSGFLTRVGQAVRYAIAGIGPDTWMSPDQPVQPTAPEAEGRQFDYRVGANIFYTPRGTELTSFEQLRALADNCDILRSAIETRKDQLAALGWMIGNVEPEDDDQDDPATKQVTQILRKPDGLHTWQSWIRMLMEELLVIDAPTIYPRKRNNGEFFAFELLDGSTIKPLIDAQGRSPLAPSPAYQQVLKGLPAVDYSRDELIYTPRNPRVHKFYGFSPVEQIILTVNIALRRSVSQLQYFTDGTIPAAFATLPAAWTPQQIGEFQEYWDTVVEGNQARNRQVRFAPDGSKITLLREAPLQDVFDEWLARVICFVFSIPPTPFIKQMNRATSQTQQETAASEGLSPLKTWVKELMDHLIQVHLGQPQLEFRWIDQAPLDPAIQATVLTSYQKQAVYSVNDMRAKLGEDPIAEDWANAYIIITAAGATPLADMVKQAAIQTKNAANPPKVQQVGPDGEPLPGKPSAGAPAKPGDEATAKLAKVSVPDEPLDKAGKKIKGAIQVALEMVRENAISALKPAEKAADDRDQSNNDEGFTEAWAGDYIANIDLSPLTLAFDDVKGSLEAVAGDGSKHQVMHIVASDPSIASELKDRGIDFMDHEDPKAIDWAANRAAALISTDSDGGMLADATRNMIRATVTQGLQAHQTLAELSDALQSAYAFSEQRAELIARTEVRNAREQGAYHGAVGVGMQQKMWLLSNDEGVCPICEANAEQGYIPITKRFSSGDQAPLAHPRCRCVAAYRRKPKEG